MEYEKSDPRGGFCAARYCRRRGKQPRAACRAASRSRRAGLRSGGVPRTVSDRQHRRRPVFTTAYDRLRLRGADRPGGADRHRHCGRRRPSAAAGRQAVRLRGGSAGRQAARTGAEASFVGARTAVFYALFRRAERNPAARRRRLHVRRRRF